MARPSPNDLRTASFARAPIGGYRHEEVNEILEDAATALEELTTENEELRSQALRLRGELDGTRGEERLLKDALLSAQRAADLLRGDALREAETIREEARRQALADRTQAQREAQALQEDVGRLQILRQRLLAESRAMLERLTHELNALDRSTPAPEPPIPPTPAPFEARAPVQTYPTRLGKTKPLKPLVTEPIILEDENGEKWVS